MNIPRNYRLLLTIAFLQGMVFYGPVATLYRRAYGLDIQGLFLIESLSWVATIALEAPWGKFADRFGYRLTLVLGNGIFLGSKFVFAAASGFSGFLLERLLLSIAISALSGCSEAMVYRSAGKASAEKAFGRMNAASGAGLFLAAVASPLLYSISYRMTAYATIVPYAAAFACSLFLVDVPEDVAASRESLGRARGVRAAFSTLVRDRRLLLFLIAAAVVGEASQAATVFLAPLQYERAGISAALFGILFAVIQGAALASAGSERLARALGRDRAFTMLMLIEAVGLAVLALTTSALITVASLITIAVAAALFRPLSSAVQNERVSGVERATALSLNAMVIEMTAAVLNVGVGAAAAGGLPLGFGVLAVVVAVLALIPARIDRRTRG